ncbi:hypothetical protein Adt_03651 [Abeliophyllum distichum]|uniref:Uncharacterized protein n=1 Tax=Abeliophyllum distichum TaxID=126358 RepID=A0ABD1W1J2_9LAMI
MVEEDLRLLRESYKFFNDIGLMLPEPNERACLLRTRCTALYLHAFVCGICLPLHPILLKDPTCIWPSSNASGSEWVESNGWGSIFVVYAFIWIGNSSACILDHIPVEETTKEERQGGGARLVLFLLLESL